jgi:radical SAM protein with 4Fe4S-binding SPASM domain
MTERFLDIELTRRCNLRCDYCFVGWSRDWSSDLPPDVVEAVIREGAGRFDVLHLTGGEPFARKDIFDVLDLGFAHGYPRALVNTNGTMLTDAHVARLAAYGGRVELSVSFDGPAAIHDRVRGDGRFAEADRALTRLLAAGVPVTVMTVVTPEVLRALAPFLAERYAAHPGLRGVTLFPVGVGPAGSQKPGAAVASLGPDELRTLAALTALAWRAGVPVTVGAFPMINPLLLALGYPAERLYQCAAGRGRVCVHADQGVSSCHPVKEPIYGRWRPGLFDQIEGVSAHRALRERDFDGCRGCEHREACGHCRAFVTANGAPLLGNDLVCHDVVPGRREAWAAQGASPAATTGASVLPASALVRRRPGDPVAVVRRFLAILGDARWEDVAAVVAADCEDRNAVPLQPPGRDGVCFKLAFWRAERPLARVTVQDVRGAEGGAVARWETAPSPGEPVTRWEGTFSVRGGEIRAFEVRHVA